MPIAPVSSLYEQIGGAPALTTLVDRFYEHLWADSSLQKYFVGIDRNTLKAHQRSFLNMALGGHEWYSGMPLKQAHAELKIDDVSFDKVADYLWVTCREIEIDEAVIMILKGAVEGFRSSVVTV
jgi:hemoglobin